MRRGGREKGEEDAQGVELAQSRQDTIQHCTSDEIRRGNCQSTAGEYQGSNETCYDEVKVRRPMKHGSSHIHVRDIVGRSKNTSSSTDMTRDCHNVVKQLSTNGDGDPIPRPRDRRRSCPATSGGTKANTRGGSWTTNIGKVAKLMVMTTCGGATMARGMIPGSTQACGTNTRRCNIMEKIVEDGRGGQLDKRHCTVHQRHWGGAEFREATEGGPWQVHANLSRRAGDGGERC